MTRFPMVLFENVDDVRGEPSGFRVLANAFADRTRLARSSAEPRRISTLLQDTRS